MAPHIAVAVDFSMPSKRMVKSLDHFRHLDAERLTLIHVRHLGYPISVSDGEYHYYSKLLQEMAHDLRTQGWEVDVCHEGGRPAAKIVETAAEEDADMILLANRGHGAIEEVVLGSVAVEVLERAEQPVFLFCSDAVSEDGAGTEAAVWNRVVCPTDFSDPADSALVWACKLAAQELVPLTVLHAFDDRYHGEREAETRQKRLDGLRKHMLQAGVQEVDTELVKGRPKRVIDESADHYRGALFVMGTHGRGWLGDLMLGGVARSMARRATHHVLFVPK